jgi:type II secretory pathway pseudopilin PulG
MDNVKVMNSKGFTLVVVIAVLAILGIIAAIAVPSVIGIFARAKEDTCNVNTLQLERKYEEYLALENIGHSDVIFTQYYLEYGSSICPEHGEISYVDGEVQHSVHPEDDGSQGSDEEDESVPYL